MKKINPAWRCLGLAVLGCAAPYVILPPVCQALPEGIVWCISFVLCYIMLPVSALIAPYCLARAGIPAIAAWPWPVLCVLILPLWGMRPGLFSTMAGIAIALVSAVTGEEMRRRTSSQDGKGAVRRSRNRKRRR